VDEATGEVEEVVGIDSGQEAAADAPPAGEGSEPGPSEAPVPKEEESHGD
jgi:hypothetical protein